MSLTFSAGAFLRNFCIPHPAVCGHVLAVLRPFRDIAPYLMACFACVKVQPNLRSLLPNSDEVGAHSVSLDLQGLLVDRLPQLEVDSEVDLLAADDAVVYVVESVVFESEILVLCGGAGWAVPTVGQLECNEHGLVALGPLNDRRNGRHSRYQLSRELSKALDFFIIYGVIRLICGDPQRRQLLCHVIQSFVERQLKACNDLLRIDLSSSYSGHNSFFVRTKGRVCEYGASLASCDQQRPNNKPNEYV